MDDRDLKRIMAKILQCAPDQITEDSSPETIPNWDSITMLNIVVALEEAYRVRFTHQDILAFGSFKGIKSVIDKLTAS